MPLIQFTKKVAKPHGTGEWNEGDRMQVTGERAAELIEAGQAKQVRRIPASYSEPEPDFKEPSTKQASPDTSKQVSSEEPPEKTPKKKSTKTKK